MAHKLCAQQTAILLPKNPKGFSAVSRGTPVRASLFSSLPHPLRLLNGGRRSGLYKIANGYATPFVTVVAGWLLLGEKISLMCIIGAVLITLGVIFAGKSDS